MQILYIVLVTDHKNQIWLGTGRGINKIIFDTQRDAVQISSLSIAGDISSAECNQGAAFYDNKNNLWFGTVSGLFKFIPDSDRKQTYLPPVGSAGGAGFFKGHSCQSVDG